ncbi:MAG: glycine zipper 2TM domain-containing protein [Pedobacter sp.]|nr:MAG: glycine zipper 2TM domain-containing protein [Pedobacter sp.]
MKKILIAVAMVATFSACNNKAKQEEAAKLQAIETQKAVAKVKDSIRLDSFKRAEAAALQAKREQEIAAAAAASASQRIRSSRSSGGSTASSNYGGTVEQKKQGWSDAAKGATIGGLAGAVGGAIIDKKKGRGAVIGGIVGAGTGYVIGREKDKKTGRAN